MSYYRESKEEIKNRMIQTALQFWNIKNIENLDPLVRLIMEALAEQLHEISNDIASLETRMMQRLSEVLLPDAVLMTKPSHTIAYLKPLWEETQITQETCFSTKTPFPNRKTQTEYAFYPACSTMLKRINVKKIISGADIYDINSDFSKRLLYRTELTPENYNKIWIGINSEDILTNLQNLSFYINFPNIDTRSECLKVLSYANWTYKGNKITVKNGIYNTDSHTQENSLDHFFENQNFNERMNTKILDFYKQNYFTIDQTLQISQDEYTSFPITDPKIQHLWQENPAVFNEKLSWIEITLPQSFKAHILSDIQVVTNTVPLINKKLHSITSTLQKGLAIIPLEMNPEEFFLGMVSISDEKDQQYVRSHGFKSSSFSRNYTLRQGGTEAFDFRNAKELLIKLQSLLEDEANIFSSLKTASSENIQLIEKLINRLERDISVQHRMGKELSYYIFLDRVYDTSYFFVKYWTTLGEAANAIRIGTVLTRKETNTSDATLITPTLGGTALPSERERIAQFKFLLNSRGRVVTNNDIKTFCIAEFPDIIADVRIEQGVSIANSLGKGLIRTIDVHLIPFGKVEDKQMIIETIYNQLVKHSPMTFNYRIFID